MELRHLRYFQVLAQELNFHRAADRLHIVQPALSKQIRELENEIGIQLLERTKRRVTLTQAGHYFLQEATEILSRAASLKNQVKLIENGTGGELRMGYVGSCIHTFLPGVLTQLHRRFPAIRTYLNELTTHSQLLAIESGELDLGFLRNPPLNPAFITQNVYSELFALVVPNGHWTTREPELDIGSLHSEEFILPHRADGDLYNQVLLSICHDAGFTPKIAHQTVHGHTVIQLVVHGLGISFLPISFQQVTQASVSFIPLSHISQRSEITAVWLANSPNPTIQSLIQLLHTSAT